MKKKLKTNNEPTIGVLGLTPMTEFAIGIVGLPSWDTYCENTNPINAIKFTLNGEGCQIWFSYKTPVAFKSGWCEPLVVRENDWSTTTGKHINAIDGGDKANRYPTAQFETLLEQALGTETE